MSVDITADAPRLAELVAERLGSQLRAIQASVRTPSLVLTGGTIAVEAYARLHADHADWSDVEVYWGDERFVPEGHVDRNDRQAAEAFLDRLGVPSVRRHPMPAREGALDAAEAAEAYAATLPDEPMDIVLLGVGPDGHVASLFPGFAQVHERIRRVVEVFDSPKPPPVRLSLTLPEINRAAQVWFLVAGEEKAEAVARALGDGSLDDTPASGAHGTDETLWLLDELAASLLPGSH